MRPNTCNRRRFVSQTKHFAPLKICRLCKTMNPKHRTGSCTNIRCGKCSGDHGIKDYPESDTGLKRPVLSHKHSLNRCFQGQMASKKALKTFQNSYKEALLSQARKATQKVSPPVQLERLLLTPDTKLSVTESLVFPETFWSGWQTTSWPDHELMARKQPERKSKRH